MKLIYNLAQSEKVDMICLGSKGRTAAASILLGSIAEGLVAINSDFPLLVVKKKNENLDFFDAIAHM